MLISFTGQLFGLLFHVALLLATTTSSSAYYDEAKGGKVLVMPYDGTESHFLVATILSKELVRRGHSVTFLLNDMHKNKVIQDAHLFQFEYYKPQVTYEADHDNFYREMSAKGLEGTDKFLEYLNNLGHDPEDFLGRNINECNKILMNNELISRLKATNYDLILADSSSMCRLPQYLRRPVAAYSTELIFSVVALYDWGMLYLDSAFYTTFLESVDRSMSFFYRLRCAVYVIYEVWRQTRNQWSYLNIQKREFSKYAHTTLNYFEDADIKLVNTHYVLDYQQPLFDNTFAVGGLTTRPSQPLSQEWKDYVNGAEPDGVIVFSYLQSIDNDTKSVFAEAFGQLPQRVIWKMDGTPPANLPDNVKVAKWIPQNDLLGHPKVKLLICQGGTNSIFEAIYHAVPMVLVPVYGNQHFNGAKVIYRGIGRKVFTISSGRILEAIHEVNGNPKYQDAISRLSAIYRDSAEMPVELAGDWLEYAMRNNGTKHLPPVSHWGVLQYLHREVFITIIILLTILITVFSGSVFFLCRWAIRKRKEAGNKFKSV